MNKKNKIKAIVAIAVALAFITPVAAVANIGTFGDETIVSIDPAWQPVYRETSFTVDVIVAPGDVTGDPEGISGVQFDLFFNQTLIQADLVEEGDLFSGHTVYSEPCIIDNVNGTIWKVNYVITDKLPLPTEPGVICTISFTSLDKLGTSPLDLGGMIKVINYWGVAVPIIVNDGSVTVEPIYYTLDITRDPIAGGTVTAYPEPHHENYYIEDTPVELTAVNASEDWVFKEWTGHLSGSTNPQTIVMSGNKAVTARFSGVGWESTMTFTGGITLAIDTVVFGESTAASDDIDGMDRPKTPAPNPPYIYAYLERTDLPDPHHMLWKEYRFHDVDNDLKVWDLIVEIDNDGGPTQIEVAITWTRAGLNAAQYDNIGLYGRSGNLLRNMKTSGGYTFTAAEGMKEYFQIRCTDNHAPEAYNDGVYTTLEVTGLNVLAPGVLANDFDVDGDKLTAVLVDDTGLRGDLDLYLDGSFDYMPDLGFSGIDKFTYKAYDGKLYSNEATVTIKVVRLNRIHIQAGWNLFSIPVGENIDKTTIVVEYLGVDYTWDDAITVEGIILGFTYGWEGGYTDGKDNTLEPGEGYWMWAYEACDLLIPSNVVADNHITYLDVGWNLVGVHEFNIPKLSILVQYDSDWLDWADAVDNDVILDFIYLWYRVDQYYRLGDRFLTGHGYWVYAYKGCALKEPI